MNGAAPGELHDTPANVSAVPTWRRSAVAVGLPLLALAAVTVLRLRFDVFGQVLADEGYLWYGAQRVLAGEFPLRDFAAYEPARYYWTAAWMWASGTDGVLIARVAAVAFEGIAIGATAFHVCRLRRSVAAAALVGVSCLLLMLGWHARYEPSAALLQALALGLMLERPSPRRWFVGGLQAGLATLLGRNVALYGGVGLALVLAAQWWADDRRALSFRGVLVAGAGLAVGSVPFLAMLVFVPGYFAAFWASLLQMLQRGATNLPLPIPWPWTATSFAHVVFGALFLLLPTVGVATFVWALVRDRRFLADQPLFAAAALLSLPYAHYVFSRADAEHLARGGAPLVLALSLLPVARAAVAAGTVAVMLVCLPQFSPALWVAERSGCRDVVVGRDVLCVPASTAVTVEGARALVARFAPGGEAVYIAPHHPGLYPALGLKSAAREIYPVLPVSPSDEVQEIQRLERAGVQLALVSLAVLDGRPELRFEVSHPLTTRYLAQRFARQGHELEGYAVFVRPGVGSAVR